MAVALILGGRAAAAVLQPARTQGKAHLQLERGRAGGGSAGIRADRTRGRATRGAGLRPGPRAPRPAGDLARHTGWSAPGGRRARVGPVHADRLRVRQALLWTKTQCSTPYSAMSSSSHSTGADGGGARPLAFSAGRWPGASSSG